MSLKEEINKLEEEAQSQLTLYTQGQDDYAYTRYRQIMEYVRKLKQSLYTR